MTQTLQNQQGETNSLSFFLKGGTQYHNGLPTPTSMSLCLSHTLTHTYQVAVVSNYPLSSPPYATPTLSLVSIIAQQ